MLNRLYGANYRFRFNGKEKDNEVEGKGDILDFGARIYDPGIGRFMCIDPDFKHYVDWSPYAISMDNPIRNIDFEGKGAMDAIKKVNVVADVKSNLAWSRSFNSGGTVVKEIGFIIAEQQTVIQVHNHKKIEREVLTGSLQTSSAGGTVNTKIVVGPDQKAIGILHTHPYSVAEGSYLGMAFSAGDIGAGRSLATKDFVTLVEAGDRRFGLVVNNEKMAKEYYKAHSDVDIQNTYNAIYKSATGTLQERVKKAVIGTLGSKSGIGFYESKADKKTFKKVN